MKITLRLTSIVIGILLVASFALQAKPSFAVTSIGFSGDLSMIQSRYGNPFRPNFEAIIPNEDNGFTHIWRNNAQKTHFHWNNYFVTREDVHHIDSVSLVQGPMGPEPGNLEFLARVGDRVAHFWREGGNGDWQGPAWLPGSGYSGTPSITNAQFGSALTFEVAIPSADKGFVYMGRVNKELFRESNLDWEHVDTHGENAGHIDAVSMVQGKFGHDGNNLELIARIGDRLAHFWRESGQYEWQGPFWLPGSGYSGNPSFIQGSMGDENRNMELAVPLTGGGFAFIWRNGDVDGLPWSEPLIVGREFGRIDSLSLVQGGFGDNHNNLELMMRVGDRLAYAWRDSSHATGPNGGWHGPDYLDLFYSGDRLKGSTVDIDLPQSQLRKFKVTFESVWAHDSHDVNDEAHWDLLGSVNGKPVELMNDYLVPADENLRLNTRPDGVKSIEVIIPKDAYFVIESNGRERDRTADGGGRSAFMDVVSEGDKALNAYLNEKYKSKLDEKQQKELTKAQKELAMWNEAAVELKKNDAAWVQAIGGAGGAGLEVYQIFSSAWIPTWGQVILTTFVFAEFVDFVADLNPDDGLGAVRVTCEPLNNFCLGTHSVPSGFNGNDGDSVNDYDLTFRVEEIAFSADDFKATPSTPSTNSNTMTVQIGGERIDLNVESSSRISDFKLDEGSRRISFRADGAAGTTGTTTIPISKVLEGPYVVTIDGLETRNVQTITNAATGNTDMKITYAHSVHDITITGTRVVPEFPLALLFTAAGIGLIVVVSFAGRFTLRGKFS